VLQPFANYHVARIGDFNCGIQDYSNAEGRMMNGEAIFWFRFQPGLFPFFLLHSTLITTCHLVSEDSVLKNKNACAIPWTHAL
jgi:hypothetical protein